MLPHGKTLQNVYALLLIESCQFCLEGNLLDKAKPIVRWRRKATGLNTPH